MCAIGGAGTVCAYVRRMRSLMWAIPASLGLLVACGSGASPGPDRNLDAPGAEKPGASTSGIDGADGGAADGHAPTAVANDGGGDGGATRPFDGDGGTLHDGAALPNDSCQTAVYLGAMSGQEGGGKVSAQGRCSKWFTVRVNETVTYNLTPIDLGVHVKLVSPDDTKFDLYTYMNVQKDLLECQKVSQSSSNVLSRVDAVDLVWPDVAFSDMSRTIAVEVRSHDGTCSTGTYSLSVAQFDQPIPVPAG